MSFTADSLFTVLVSFARKDWKKFTYKQEVKRPYLSVIEMKRHPCSKLNDVLIDQLRYNSDKIHETF